MSSTPRTDAAPDRRTLLVGGTLVGMGLGGFVDGVVIHQILQWHHLTTAAGQAPGLPTSLGALQDDTRWDGLFHAGTWVLTVIGLVLIWRALRCGIEAGWPTLVGLLLAGWGLFNLLEGIVDHQILGIHHVRDDLGGPLSWDLGFLAFGALLVVAGVLLCRRDRRTWRPPVDRRDRGADESAATPVGARRDR